jgi:hypothetical protein
LQKIAEKEEMKKEAEQGLQQARSKGNHDVIDAKLQQWQAQRAKANAALQESQNAETSVKQQLAQAQVRPCGLATFSIGPVPRHRSLCARCNTPLLLELWGACDVLQHKVRGPPARGTTRSTRGPCLSAVCGT